MPNKPAVALDATYRCVACRRPVEGRALQCDDCLAGKRSPGAQPERREPVALGSLPIDTDLDAMASRLRQVNIGVDLASGPSWGVIELPGLGRRTVGGREELRLTLRTPPRTSKNHTTLGIKQSVAYRRYETWIRDTLRPYIAALELPLPDEPVNVCAVFYYDGAEPDLHGLMQGLADALEADGKRDWAGVLTNDRLIAGWDGSRKVHDPIRPRVELTITPIGAQP